ncbi:type I restriction-modification system methyltransferase subunit [Candidatus Nitrososphaera evergladensis SR1]|uniref:site-specific DNA-methyltransferase (adenine-specific) n=1 Tax=Candidatus Nitrososphaera evergladensis SR1 TaxID=1459636 RepID=A0A075MV36_9ARCH|nr:class I SAM-dependent DNA methyltransferase [Candidatus Nitrososphaera evergladensis]AIF85023.1 type I restriction-modification system methyltransferase subunit [Candidatus Nitrososphaera evergladensis SR1]
MALSAELKQHIDSLWNKFWAGGITNPLTAIEQMSYLIFMKRLEDLDNLHAKRASQRKDMSYVSVFKGHEDCKWSHWKHYNADSMLKHVRDKVFEFIKTIHNGDDALFAQYMKDAVFVIPKPQLLQEAVAIIDKINITAQNQDVQGDIYEHLLSQLQTSGKNGQFRTPRHIIRLMVTLIDPKIGEKICDPACGTAGFLIGAYEHILAANTSHDIIERDANGVPHNLVGDKIVNKAHWKLLRNETFYGFEVDTTMIRIALMNMILHGVEHPNIRYADSISKSFDQKELYDVVLANPPFTGFVDESTINDNFQIRTAKTELLFLELMHNILHRGGRCAVIVPEGALFANSNAHKNIRKILVENCQVEGIISLPAGVFKPYAGVATSIVLFTKGGRTEQVWFYGTTADGYSLDDKRVPTPYRNDIPDIIKKWSKKQVDNERTWVASYQQIVDNDYSLSANRYKPSVRLETKYEDPSVLLNQILNLENEIQSELRALNDVIEQHQIRSWNAHDERSE